ncbi:LPS export ABC transporter permease LptF [Thalassotalea ponticola]|uniref:LPS export ABC transporter permease LptF n=1 Tax=Thalassotalea ponticola TaxID=1523392 RepID=UPI0025B403E3|nr:LPS export ABC transporter permease LptF [Thalassotalea ponticola]MDN3653408.1 LPS export ABC transporter permease LptF [Thalassotalea ponticola]
MIIFRYLLNEVGRTQLGVFFVLMTIFISQKFVRILGDASDGDFPAQMVITFMGLTIPHLMGVMLPLSLFLAILIAYGRIYAENEMTVLHACGVSEWYVVRVTLLLAIVVSLITGLFTLYLSPLAQEKEYQVKEQLAKDIGLTALVAGRFQKTSNEEAVVFIQNIGDNKELQDIFVAQLPKDETGKQDIVNVIYAKSGKVIEAESGEQTLIMNDGNRYQKNNVTTEFETMEFAGYQMKIQDKKVEERLRKLSAIPTKDLLTRNDSSARTELQWRLSFPISVLILTLIAVPLSVVNPRQGKFAKMFPALLLFLVYYLLLTSARSAMDDGVIAPSVGLWPIHITALFVGWMLLLRSRSSGKKLKARLKRGNS